ncbi:hypothetical protein [Candidatus Thiothrix anitrata]|uniref:Uncharacterized protein n=1 Tax=Candidatus Thiothrix anitrata TaxID=2823902 RepID=A0ABX7X8A0_9GAMM|nr:hypothetical protein [Candidatus Thiothrix anitrata]QTR50835.1 hypothetical protein J8380_04515 [Candidatus Thiothrix anitrata]
MDINEMADKVMGILRKLEEDTKEAAKEGAQSPPEQPKESEKPENA